MKEFKGIIYKTTNLANGKIYVCQDKHNNPKYKGSGKLLWKAIRKYGFDNFVKEILEHCKSLEHLNEQEKFWIRELDACNKDIAYNISKGGQFGDVFTNNPNKELIRKNISVGLTSINPITNKSISTEIGIKISKHLAKINPANGLTYAKTTGIKVKATNQKINIDSGLTNYQEIAIKSANTRKTKIDKDSGLTVAVAAAHKAIKRKKSIIDANGFNLIQLASKASDNTKRYTINADTGLSLYQEIGKKISIALNVIQSNGLTVAQNRAIKSSNANKLINADTGLSIADEIGIKGSVTKYAKKVKLAIEYDSNIVKHISVYYYDTETFQIMKILDRAFGFTRASALYNDLLNAKDNTIDYGQKSKRCRISLLDID